MKRHATALRAFTHADESFAAEQVILNMDPGQFADWSADGVGLVREATAAEVATARGDKPVAAKKRARSRAKVKPAAPVAAPETPPAPATVAPDA